MTEPLSRAQRVRQLFEAHNYVLASVSNVLEVMRVVESEEIASLQRQLAQVTVERNDWKANYTALQKERLSILEHCENHKQQLATCQEDLRATKATPEERRKHE